MSNDEGYNGWTNYQTWNVALWLDNDQGLCDMAREIASRDYEYNFERDDALREFVEELADGTLSQASMASDLLGHAIAYVNWTEIAEVYRDEAGVAAP